MNVPGWKDAVVVSKNPGGTKRVTSLADVLKLNFAIVTTQPRRTNIGGSLEGSALFDTYGEPNSLPNYDGANDARPTANTAADLRTPPRYSPRSSPQINGAAPTSVPRHIHVRHTSSPLTQSTRLESSSPPTVRTPIARDQPRFTMYHTEEPEPEGEDNEDLTDERAREVITGRLYQGHIIDDNSPSPAYSSHSGSVSNLPLRDGLTTPFRNGPSSPVTEEADPMALSFMSSISRRTTDHTGVDGRDDGASDDDEEGFKDPDLEHTVTLVGNVHDRVVLIMDDMIDQPGSWIAAAETVVKRGDAKEVYCIATHGIFGGESLELMEECECIDHIIVTNTYPIEEERLRRCRKLVVLDMSHLLAEAIRRNHYGESISALFQHFPD